MPDTKFVQQWCGDNGLTEHTIQVLIREGLTTEDDLAHLNRNKVMALSLNMGQEGRLCRAARRIALSRGIEVTGNPKYSCTFGKAPNMYFFVPNRGKQTLSSMQ